MKIERWLLAAILKLPRYRYPLRTCNALRNFHAFHNPVFFSLLSFFFYPFLVYLFH